MWSFTNAAHKLSICKVVIPGFNTFAGTDPQNKVTIVVWANLDPTVDGRAAATLIAKSLIDEMYGSSTPTPTR